MHTGTVKFFNTEKGFGFIIDDSDKKEYFVHKTGLKSTDIGEGDNVAFNLVEGKKGLNAVNVTLIP